MGAGSSKGRIWLWLLVAPVLALVLLGLAGFLILPGIVQKWLGGDDFRMLASRQLSTFLQTKGELEPLQWSSFTVSSAGFASRPNAPGPWVWEIRDLSLIHI